MIPASRAVLLLALASASALGAEGPLAPGAELATFRLADPGLAAELVVAEPDVESPVSMAWDEHGALYVAEMRDYPNAAEGGRIRRIRWDGRRHDSVVFADGLHFPGSVLPWRGGVLVAAAPGIWFLRDADGDGRADERTEVLTGFGTGNQQLRANALQPGPDGWIYGANGRSDGAVRVPGTTNAWSLRGRDFRFRWDGRRVEFETLAGKSQFGLGLDDWGHRFLSWNTIPARHEVFPDRFLARNPWLPAAEVLQDCLPPDDDGAVFPLTPPPLVFNNESASHFNALSGLHVFRGDALGPAYRGNLFVGESLRNLVHRRVPVPDGPTFRAVRGEAGREFLASSDPWFHPVSFATGPDGALYVADFYRRFVEHPDWVAKDLRAAVTWDEGREHGRIWRIRAASRPLPATGSLLAPRGQDDAMLASRLGSANGHASDTAARLLLERGPATSKAVRPIARRAARPEARAQALRLLAALGSLDDATERRALRDASPRVREVAAGLARDPRWLLPLETDPDPAVRLHVALGLGDLGGRDAATREATLRRMTSADTNRWLFLAAATATRDTNAPWLAALRPKAASFRAPPVPRDADPDRERVIARLRPALATAGDRRRGAATFATLCAACHQVQGRGRRVGPDLAGLAAKPPETLLSDILDPSRQVAPDYQLHEVTTTDGETHSGLIASESDTRLTLRRAGAPDESFARAKVRSVRATGRSLMPDGLEAGWTTRDFADLLAFLRDPDGTMLD